MKNKLLLTSFVTLLPLSFNAFASFNVTVTLNNVTQKFSFPDAETALSTNQLQFRDDFVNPDTGERPNSAVGQITQFSFDGFPLTFIKTGSETTVLSPVSGTTSEFITFTGDTNSVNDQVQDLLTTGKISNTATVGLDDNSQAELETIIAEQIPDSNQNLKNRLTTDIKNTTTSTSPDTGNNDDTTPTKTTSIATISKQLTTKLAFLSDSSIREDGLLAQYNPTASIAGNPSSLMGTMVSQIFQQNALTGRYATTRTSAAASSDRTRGFSFNGGLDYNYYNLAGRTVHTISAPLSLGIRFNADHQLTVSLPLTYIDTEGTSSYQAGGGLAYKYNIFENWALTPAINYAYRGTPKSGKGLSKTEGHILSGTLTSKYIYNFDPKDRESFKISLMNMVGYFQALNMETEIGNNTFQTSGQVANTVLKNGVSISKRVGVFDISAFFTDTEYFGSKLYFDQYNEAGVAIRTDRAGRFFDALSLQANYLFSINNSELDGFKLSFQYSF